MRRGDNLILASLQGGGPAQVELQLAVSTAYE